MVVLFFNFSSVSSVTSLIELSDNSFSFTISSSIGNLGLTSFPESIFSAISRFSVMTSGSVFSSVATLSDIVKTFAYQFIR